MDVEEEKEEAEDYDNGGTVEDGDPQTAPEGGGSKSLKEQKARLRAEYERQMDKNAAKDGTSRDAHLDVPWEDPYQDGGRDKDGAPLTGVSGIRFEVARGSILLEDLTPADVETMKSDEYQRYYRSLRREFTLSGICIR